MGKKSKNPAKKEFFDDEKNINWLDKDQALEALSVLYPQHPPQILEMSIDMWRKYRSLDGKQKKQVDKMIKDRKGVEGLTPEEREQLSKECFVEDGIQVIGSATPNGAELREFC